MNSDYDFTLNSSESSSSGEARNRFLDSLGMGENALRGLDENQGESPKADEGLVLSSQPDLGEPEASVDLSKGRAISISVNRGAAVNRSLEISLPASPKAEATGDFQAMTPVASSADDLDIIINLNCPECAGDLVIKRRHLGVEGACVWCHVPIVAAETARDRQVRVFPLLGGIQKPEATIKPAVEQKCEAREDMSPAPWKPLDTAVDSNLTTTPGTESLNAITPDPSDSFIVGNAGFNPSLEPFAPKNDGPSETIAHEDAMPTENPMPMDLEDLYASAGFGLPAAEKESNPGFGETLANLPKEPAAFNPAGFGAFLQSPIPIADRDTDGPSPSPWAATTTPLVFSPEPPAPESVIQAEAATLLAGVAGPAPWGPPTKFVPDETVIDAPPALIVEETGKEAPPSDWASAFEKHRESDSVSALKETDSPEILPEPSAFAGFESAFGASLPEPETPENTADSADTTSGFFFSNTPTSTMLFGTNDSGAESFAMPGHCFSTGSSSEPEPKSFDALFPSSSGTETQSPIFEAVETGNPDETSARLEPVGGDSLFPSSDQGPSLFGESPFVSFNDEPATEPSFPSPQGNAFSDLTPATSLPATVSEHPPTFSPIASDLSTSPVIASLPLNNPPKPRVRRGFMVLMVIIVGFASGAALASFVLPVEEYVQTARAFMEKQFNTADMTQQIPVPLPTGTDVNAEITVP